MIRITQSRRTTSRGFTIVELMVGLAIGLVLVAGLALIFANSSRSREELGKSVEQIENGRYAIALLEDDVSLAGFYAELPAAITRSNVPDACAVALGSGPVGSGLGWNSTALSAPVPIMGLSSAAAGALACLPDHKSGTPAFVVHRLSTESVAPAAVTSVPYVQTSRCASEPAGTPPFTVSATVSDFKLRDFKCAALNSVRRYVSRIYYVASCNECALETANQIPTLKMAELRAGSSGLVMAIEPLVEGIEDIEVQYGFDMLGVGNADKFLTELSGTAGAADNTWENVVAVRLHLLTRTTEPSPGFTDGGKKYDLGRAALLGPFSDQFKRRVYTTTVRLPNVAGPREVPASPASSPASS